MPILLHFFQAPASDWLRFAAFLVGIVSFVLVAEWSRHRQGWSAEINRKLVHVGTGILILFSPVFFETAAPLISMALLFTLLNAWGIKTGRLRGMHPAGRASYGTVLYPLAFGVLTALCWNGGKAVLIPAISVLAFGDAAAALVGENLKRPHRYRLAGDEKSLEGSGVMAVVSFLAVFLTLPYAAQFDGTAITVSRALLLALLTAPVATALEALSTRGSDNLTAPLGSAFVLWFGLTQPPADVYRLALATVLALVVALVSFRARFLSGSGATATFVLAVVIFGTGGWQWAGPILVFFVLSSLLSKTGKKAKAKFDLMFEKSSRRDAGQVMANGGVAGAAVLLNLYFPHPLWYAAYLAALASATADTWATEIGVFSKTAPKSILSFKPVIAGTSGGITPLGTTAAFIGSTLIAFTGWAVTGGQLSLITALVVTLAGFMGSLSDSLLGATLQAQYRCPVCEKRTERQNHCNNNPTILISGLHWLNNDWVNGLAALFGAILAGLWTSVN